MMNFVLDNIIFSLQEAGGISVFWHELITRMSSDQDNGCRFLDYTGCENNIFYVSPGSAGNTPREMMPSRLFERYRNPDIRPERNFIFHSSYYRYSDSSRAANVVTVHDFTYEYFGRGLAKVIHHAQKAKAIDSADAIICVSESTKRDLLKMCPKTDEGKIYVVYNGVSEHFYKMDIAGSTAPVLPFDKFSYAIYVGDRKPGYKNFKSVVRAVALHKDLRLVIVGGGVPTKEEAAFLDKVLGKERFKWAGLVSNEELNMLYNFSFALVYPSLYEGFGIPVVEAQKAGCPVITSVFSSLPEIGGDGAILLEDLSPEGIFYSLCSLEDKIRRDRLINLGMINSTRFSWDTMFEEMLKVYERLWLTKFGDQN